MCVEAVFRSKTMTFTELKNKALQLPLQPGVYIMRDKWDNVIYVGKAKKLKNRVCQYFQDVSSHTPKTALMVSRIDHFDVIVAASEFEALVLEASLIKKHMPKYNILLKDDKGYPFVRITTNDAYPSIQIASKKDADGEYFGPYGSRNITNKLIETLRILLMLPQCSKKFPRDINKGRPCLHYHMGQCAGWCQREDQQEEYCNTIHQAKQLLRGNYKYVADQVRSDMLKAADEMNFELAASLRDKLSAIEALGTKQFVSMGAFADTDVVGYGESETKGCFTILHYRDGTLLDKEYEVFPLPEDKTAAVSSLLSQYYIGKKFIPKRILLPFQTEDTDTLAAVLSQAAGRKILIHTPQRGENAKLVSLACKNAQEEAARVTSKEERIHGALSLLGKMLGISAPHRIESFDISNISGTDIVAGMVVFQDGKPHKSDYKRFKIEGLDGQDDYGSMEQALTRRFKRYCQGDAGFTVLPDLLLIDGGENHAAVAAHVTGELGLNIPIFGMVKDDRHRTRALVTCDGKQIDISSQQAVFSLIGSIQEETHRYAITYHRSLRSKRLTKSALDSVPGIGP